MSKKTTLWIVGDSTVSAFNDDYYMPRYGWGAVINKFLSGDIVVENLAVSGTSSKSFRKHANYEKFVSGIGNGDILMIGFGHNDEKSGDVTFTDPSGDYNTPGSFANSLYEYYIKIAEKNGAESILVTPIVRRDESMNYQGDKVHITSFGDYAKAIRKLGEDLNIFVCDLTNKTLEVALSCDKDDIKENDTLFQHARTGSAPLSVDDTHTSYFGAMVNAYLIVKELEDKDTSLESFIKDNIQNPLDKAAELVSKSINKNYVDPVYEMITEPDIFWPKYIDANDNVWYGTVFGDVNKGSCKSTDEFTLGKDNDGCMIISAGKLKNNGKIMNKSDGLAMYFVRIPIKDSFELSGKIKINGFNTAGDAADYSAFGAMVRDDMYMNEQSGLILGDYVAAGVTFRPGFETGSNTFARKSGLCDFEGGKLRKAPKTGDEFIVRVYSTPDGYGAQIGGYDPVISGYDYALNKVDTKYVYVGFFVARTVSISVSDIKLLINSKEVFGYDCFFVREK